MTAFIGYALLCGTIALVVWAVVLLALDIARELFPIP